MKRETFSSRLGFILVSAGCAIGLGNVWKFPYMCGQYGGAVFILCYIVFLALFGLPIIVCEFAVGRGSRQSIATSFSTLAPRGTRWGQMSYFGLAGNYLLMMFYTMVAGWLVYYCVRTFGGAFNGADTAQVAAAYSGMLQSPGTMTLWTAVVWALCLGVCALGLENGVEKITKVMMALLLAVMVLLGIRSVTLSGAGEGLRFYLVPDLEKVKEQGFAAILYGAMNQSFFTLSVGIGSMAIFGSYMKKDRSITGEAVRIIALDTFVALTAGIIVIPACFAFGINPDSGPSLLFLTLPNVFSQMAGGQIWGGLFFLFMSFAALSTVVAVYENIISFGMDKWGWTRKKSVAINGAALLVLSLPAVLGMNVWSGIQPLGATSNLREMEDFIVTNSLLPLGSVVFVLFCVRKNGWGWDNFLQEVNTGAGRKFPTWLRGYMGTVLPVAVGVIYIKGYYDTMVNVAQASVLRTVLWVLFGVFMVWFVISTAFFPRRDSR